MPNYAYRGYTDSGQRRDGQIEASGTSAAEQALWKQGLKVVRLSTAPAKKTMADHFPSLFHISRMDIILFTRQLGTFVGAGVPMSRGLGTIAEETGSPLFKRIILAILEDLWQSSPGTSKPRSRNWLAISVETSTLCAGFAPP